MGSLMAGWDSPVLGDDNNKVRARRNRSLTKEEVETFWKQRRRRSEDGGAGQVSSSPLGSPAALIDKYYLSQESPSPFGSLEKARSPAAAARGSKQAFTPAVRVDGFPAGGDEMVESPSTSRDWWTRSTWAFLNEPPQEEPSGTVAQRYTPQFHVARIATGGASN